MRAKASSVAVSGERDHLAHVVARGASSSAARPGALDPTASSRGALALHLELAGAGGETLGEPRAGDAHPMAVVATHSGTTKDSASGLDDRVRQREQDDRGQDEPEAGERVPAVGARAERVETSSAAGTHAEAPGADGRHHPRREDHAGRERGRPGARSAQM